MTSQKQIFPSFASIISVVSTVFYCAGFLRVEFQLRENKGRINALEEVTQTQPTRSGRSFTEAARNSPGKLQLSCENCVSLAKCWLEVLIPILIVENKNPFWISWSSKQRMFDSNDPLIIRSCYNQWKQAKKLVITEKVDVYVLGRNFMKGF